MSSEFSRLAQLQVVPPRYSLSQGFTREAFCERLKPLNSLMRPIFRCLHTWDIQSVAGCLAWDLLAWDIGSSNFS